ncbi:MAG: hypothetical protein M1818_005216 [Claussenomyces sp. TS43310]|nr:MAG: hypothetical protein M1818_005216 [Claussenomyces sp. TS43310]
MSFDAFTPQWDLGTHSQDAQEEFIAGDFFEQNFNAHSFCNEEYDEESFQDFDLVELPFLGASPAQEETPFDASPRGQCHSRNTSQGSVDTYYSSNTVTESVSTQLTTPTKSPTRQLGPLLLPKIRSQDQVIETSQPMKRKAPANMYRRPNQVHAQPVMVDFNPWNQMFNTPPQTIKRQAVSDVNFSAKRARTGPLANAWTPSNPRGRPCHNRSISNLETVLPFPTMTPTMTPTPPHSRSSSASCSPVSVMTRPTYQRRESAPDVNLSSELDMHSLYKFGFPYRNLPAYLPNTREPSPLGHEVSFNLAAQDLVPVMAGPTTTLTAYLTAPNPALSLVSHIHEPIRDPSAKHYWWDVRQIRAWTSFDASSILSVPDLASLLSIPIACAELPTPPAPRTTRPSSEGELHSAHAAHYATKLNAALATALGSDRFVMGSSPCSSSSSSSRADQQPAFRSIYLDDLEATSLGHSRVVGLVRSNEVWNNTMRAQGNVAKVRYLRGLADLHGQMRAHHCRYGFILTETELTVVRNGERPEPHFGYLELRTIDLKEHLVQRSRRRRATPTTTTPHASSEEGHEAADDNDDGDDNDDNDDNDDELRMTPLLALFYLHVLARRDPLPGQPAAYADIGAPAAGSRRSCLPKDAWMPEPQLAEKRAAKRARGWVWPEEPVCRKELGKRGVAFADYRRAAEGVAR